MKISRREILVGTISLVFTLSLFILPMQLGANMAYVQTRNTIAVIQTNSDPATAVAIDEMSLSQFGHPIKYIQVNTLAQLQVIAETSFYLITIYVGHGNPEGLQIGASLVPWLQINTWTEKADLTFHIFAACHSVAAMSIDSPQSFGFPGPIDAHIVGLVSQMIIAALFDMIDLVQSLLIQLFSASYLALLLHPLLPLAWGPWTPWYTDEAINTVLTGLFWLALTLGLGWLIPEIAVIIGAFGTSAIILGWLSQQWVIGLIAAFAQVFSIVCFRWRVRYDPQLELFQEQYKFSLRIAGTDIYWFDTYPLSYVHG
jgi:hypothetical protein